MYFHFWALTNLYELRWEKLKYEDLDLLQQKNNMQYKLKKKVWNLDYLI